MRIVCIKWGDKYGDEYVTRLKRGCEKHIPHDEFVCMTDKPVPGVICVPLNTDLPTWWSKIGLFRHGFFVTETLYLDLDIVISGPIDPLFEAFYSDKSKLWALDDFSYSIAKHVGVDQKVSGWLGGPGNSTINSSVMMWDKREAGYLRRVFDDFTPEVMDDMHGDQNWITRSLWPEINLFPQGVAGSWKYHKGEKYPLTVFHGNPKPHDIKEGWVPKEWAA